MILIIAVGLKQPDWVNKAFDDYAQRLPTDYKITLKEVKAEPRTSGKSVDAIKISEAKRITTVLAKESARVSLIRVALDERGKSQSTEEFSEFLNNLTTRSNDIAFIIGGPDGLADDLKNQCPYQIRLSSLTLPHGLVRVYWRNSCIGRGRLSADIPTIGSNLVKLSSS